MRIKHSPIQATPGTAVLEFHCEQHQRQTQQAQVLHLMIFEWKAGNLSPSSKLGGFVKALRAQVEQHVMTMVFALKKLAHSAQRIAVIDYTAASNQKLYVCSTCHQPSCDRLHT